MRLILHAGTQKTGTSAIQASLSENRSALQKEGIFYPQSRHIFGGSQTAHHEFAHTLAGRTRSHGNLVRQFVTRLKSEARSDETVLLSSEALYRHVHGYKRWDQLSPREYWVRRLRYIETVSEVLSDFDVEVLLCLRRQDNFAESLYAEGLTKSPSKLTFSDWRRRSSPLFDYTAQVAAFATQFPFVTILQYEEAAQAGLIKSFFDQLGIEAPDATVRLRESADARLLLWMRDRRPGTSKQRREFSGSEDAVRLFDDHGDPTLWASAEERDRFLGQFGGAYGASFFPSPSPDLRPARLTDADRERIDRAWQRWLGRRRAHQSVAITLDRTRPWLSEARRAAVRFARGTRARGG